MVFVKIHRYDSYFDGNIWVVRNRFITNKTRKVRQTRINYVPIYGIRNGFSNYQVGEPTFRMQIIRFVVSVMNSGINVAKTMSFLLHQYLFNSFRRCCVSQVRHGNIIIVRDRHTNHRTTHVRHNRYIIGHGIGCVPMVTNSVVSNNENVIPNEFLDDGIVIGVGDVTNGVDIVVDVRTRLN